MKSGILTTLVENIKSLKVFIPEEDILVERVVSHILQALRSQAAEVSAASAEERTVATYLGLSGSLKSLGPLAADPVTKEMLTSIGKEVLRFYEHVDQIELMSKAGGPN